MEDENVMNNEKIEAINKRQSECDHLGEYEAAGQQSFEDTGKGLMVLITTVMCKKCGLLFFDTQETNIKARVSVIPAIPSGGDENGKTN